MGDVTLAATFIDGTVIRASGFIDIEGWESESNKLTLGMFPRDNKWEVFAGSGDPDRAGSLKSVSIAGVTYCVLGDANLSLLPAEYKNEALPTSGGNIRKMTKQVRALTAVTISCNAQERETLRAIAEG
jgi:hypothetical protein